MTLQHIAVVKAVRGPSCAPPSDATKHTQPQPKKPQRRRKLQPPMDDVPPLDAA